MRHEIIAIATAAALLACGSQESKLERGIVPGEEEAVPQAVNELDMTEEERQRQNLEEEGREEQRAFDEADERG